MRNLKLTPQRVECPTVTACPDLKNIAESLIRDAAAPCILIGQDKWGLIASRQIKSSRVIQSVDSLTQLGWVLHRLLQFIMTDKYDTSPALPTMN
ncbi:hypothetical protein EVAR_99551_1 [Eumeta japonica]|uniref:Uncharacterized protein n=1 Tax=Eumeta variegata TaxID=151549 RepID=A0A4C1YT51_EUMVA|nr:hypothetical protein EVAR_99551_1 [Eumeta japonica]